MSDLLKEAIADAKAVRETALQNAKMALEEAFTPHLKSMLSAKLAEDDMEDEDEDAVVDIDIDADDEEEVEAEEGAEHYREEDDEEMDMGDEEEVDESEIIEIDGVKYAPIVSEEDEMEDEDEEVEESEELDLEAVIKELEEELEEAGDPGDEEESVNEADEDDSETVEEEVVTEEETTEEETVDEEVVNEEEDSEELDEYSGTVAQKRKKSGNAPRINNENEEVDALQSELKEYKEAVTFLRDKLHEVNILNAKLLYTNKLFKEYVLSNDQKLKIVETFDRAQTTREIKLVYSTLAESYKDNGGEKKEVVKEFASKKSGGTAPKTKIITEESQVANRFQKLAGIMKS